ncbi:MAG: mycofactocin precursor MftA [Microthrixaceae bacterium]
MAETLTDQSPEAVVASPADPDAAVEALVDDELLVEEVSIDGMCGVY